MIFINILKEATGLSNFSHTILLPIFIRGIITYFLGITLARFNKTLMGIRTPFNFLLFMMLGSLAANAIVDPSLFLPILATVTLLALLNGLVTMFAFYIPAVENFAKGTPAILISDGEIQWKTMRKHFITGRELLDELHRKLHTRDYKEVEKAILASDGSINFTKKH